MWSELIDTIVAAQVALFFALVVIAMILNRKAYLTCCVFLVYLVCSATDSFRYNSEFVGYIYFSFTSLMLSVSILLIAAKPFFTERFAPQEGQSGLVKFLSSRLFKVEKFDRQDIAIIGLFIAAKMTVIMRYIDYWYLKGFSMGSSYRDIMLLIDMLVLGTVIYPFFNLRSIKKLLGSLSNGTRYIISSFRSVN